MRLLVVNPNTSVGVTARIREAAQAVAHPGDRIVTIQAAFGPALIVTEANAAEAARGVVAAVQAHSAAYDGVVLASFGDTGAAEVRKLKPGLPVIGIAGAGFAAVRALGGPFGIVTFGTSLVPGLQAKAREYGLADALIGVEAVPEGDLGDPGTVQARVEKCIARLCSEMASRGARSVLLGGGPLAGLARRIGPDVPVPVIDGTQAAVGLMRAMTDGAAARAPGPDAVAGSV